MAAYAEKIPTTRSFDETKPEVNFDLFEGHNFLHDQIAHSRL